MMILPPEVYQEHIFNLLDGESLAKCIVVCRGWSKIASLDKLWKPFAEAVGLSDPATKINEFVQKCISSEEQLTRSITGFLNRISKGMEARFRCVDLLKNPLIIIEIKVSEKPLSEAGNEEFTIQCDFEKEYIMTKAIDSQFSVEKIDGCSGDAYSSIRKALSQDNSREIRTIYSGGGYIFCPYIARTTVAQETHIFLEIIPEMVVKTLNSFQEPLTFWEKWENCKKYFIG